MNMRISTVVMLAVVLASVSPSRVAAQSGSDAARTGAQAAACPHGIESARCPFCTPSLVESLGDCREHGVPEALCVQCRPFLRPAFIAAGDWCAEHATPESLCSLCSPGQPGVTGVGLGDDRRFRQDPSVNCSTASTTVTLASAAVARTAGFEFAEVRVGALSKEIVRNAEIAYDANRYARLSSRAPGVVIEVRKDLGDRVLAGEVVATIDSMAVGSAKADLLQASELLALWQANAERERVLMEKGAGTERALLEAQTRLAEARIAVSRAKQQLRNLGLADDDIAGVIATQDTGSLLRIVAPFAGTVVERSAVIGEVVDEKDRLFALADTGLMWAMIDLSEADLSAVRAGQRVRFRSDGMRGAVFAGTLTWVSTQLDPKTRTVRARAELDNGMGLLKAFMFGRATIVGGAGGTAVTVPKDAVQWEGCCNVAFVRADEAGTVYEPARLVLGFDAGDRYEVVSGLSGGETVVTRGSYILKNEILKDAVGAGCCEVDHLAK